MIFRQVLVFLTELDTPGSSSHLLPWLRLEQVRRKWHSAFFPVLWKNLRTTGGILSCLRQRSPQSIQIQEPHLFFAHTPMPNWQRNSTPTHPCSSGNGCMSKVVTSIP